MGDIELVISREHVIESREIAERRLDDLSSCVHKDSMYNWRDFSKLFRTASGQKQAKGKLTMRFLIEGTDDLV
jgi:hypothetical protein